MKKLFILLVVFMFFASCGKSKEVPTQKAEKYLAKVNNVAITEEDARNELNALPPQIRGVFIAKGGMEGFIEELITKELLYQEAKKKRIERSEEFKKKFDSMRKIMMIEVLLDEMVDKKVNVSEKDAKDFYEKNKANFVITDGKRKHVVEFDKIKDLLKDKLKAQKQREVFQSYISALKNTSIIELNNREIARLSNNAEVRP